MEEYAFKRYPISEGLSQSTVKSMLQDSKGYLWFGTANGLNRFDGYSFKIYVNDPLDSTSLSDNGVLSIFEDSKGFLWIGTINGSINKFNRKTGVFSKYNFIRTLKTEKDPNEATFEYPLPYSRFSDLSVTSIIEDDDGKMWFGTWGKGLIKFDTETQKIIHFKYSSSANSQFNVNKIMTLLKDKDNTIWVGTVGRGIYKIVKEKNEYKTVNFSSKNNRTIKEDKIFSLVLDNKSNLWIGTFGDGLYKLRAKEQANKPSEAIIDKIILRGSQSNNSLDFIVTSLAIDENGGIWIASFRKGVYRLDTLTGEQTNFINKPNDPNSLTKNDVISLMIDKSGSLWVGTHLGKGLEKLERNREKFKQINKSNDGLNDDVIWAIYQGSEPKTWIGTYKGGLNLWDRKTNKFYYFKNNYADSSSISDNHVRAIAEHANGNLWIGTYSGGLNIFNKNTKKFTRYLYNKNDSTSISGNQVQSILFDKNGNAWIGIFGGGLCKVTQKDIASNQIKFQRIKYSSSDPFGLSDNRIYSLYEDKEGFIWVGTFGGGLNKYNPAANQFLSYKYIPGDKTSLSDNRVMAIHEDRYGRIWIGTYGGGLLRFDKKKELFYRYKDINKMMSSVVYGILEDRHRNLWLSTDNGLLKFDLLTEQIAQYDIYDGVQNLEFSGGAYCKSPNGEMFFGGINGFNYFYPYQISDNKYIPPIAITSFRVFNDVFKGEQDSITLDYNQNFFAFEFSSLDYTLPQDNQYAYMLEGFNKEWIYVNSQRRIASYTNLPPGNYTFRVIGSNNDGTWNFLGATVYLKILPPFYRKWWFILSVIASLVCLVYYLATARYRSLLTIEKLKSKLAADLHDSIGSGLTEISILSELVTQESLRKGITESDNLKLISERARSLIDNMSDIVWMVNPKRDSFHDLIVRLKDTYSDLLNSYGISFKTTNLEKLDSVKLPMEHKQNLFLIFKEGINNSIKHSRCSRISLEADFSKEVLRLSLVDNGIGIPSSNEHFGNGITNMINRAAAIGGNLDINSTKEGTSVTYTGSINNVGKFLSLIKNKQ